MAGGGHRGSQRRRPQALAAQEVEPGSVRASAAPHVPELARSSLLKFYGGLALTPDGLFGGGAGGGGMVIWRINLLLGACGMPRGCYGQRYGRGCQPDYEEHGLRCWICGCSGICGGGRIPPTPDTAPMTPKQLARPIELVVGIDVWLHSVNCAAKMRPKAHFLAFWKNARRCGLHQWHR